MLNEPISFINGWSGFFLLLLGNEREVITYSALHLKQVGTLKGEKDAFYLLRVPIKYELF
jgi:hypothetical protein